jgi:ATP-binding cassette subfamily B protein
LRDNLTLRIPGMRVDEARTLELIERLGLSDVLGAHPLEFVMTEGGSNLSGGQQQRVALLRALQVQRAVLILDEATSALDTETEREIQAELKAMGQGRTVITIAHRLSTIADADRIVVLEDGVIVEEGTHDALLDQEGRYAHLWHRQETEEQVAA